MYLECLIRLTVILFFTGVPGFCYSVSNTMLCESAPKYIYLWMHLQLSEGTRSSYFFAITSHVVALQFLM